MSPIYNNHKSIEKLIIKVSIESFDPDRGNINLTYNYTPNYLYHKDFDIDILRKELKHQLMRNRVIKNNQSKIINHIIASITDYKRYIDGIRNRG